MRYISDVTDEKGEKIVGVELDRSVGDTDGTVNGHRLFTCQFNHGAFVRRASVKVRALLLLVGGDSTDVLINDE